MKFVVKSDVDLHNASSCL